MILINIQLLINVEFHQWSQFCLQNMNFGPNWGHLKGKKKSAAEFIVMQTQQSFELSYINMSFLRTRYDLK